MHSGLLGFALGFFVALQLGPMSLLLIRSTLRGGWIVGAAIGERAVALADALAGLGTLGFGGALAFSTVHRA
jgi:putative LysE/RhtB family amino acid efflux pump